jgi:hypothetical protein
MYVRIVRPVLSAKTVQVFVLGPFGSSSTVSVTIKNQEQIMFYKASKAWFAYTILHFHLLTLMFVWVYVLLLRMLSVSSASNLGRAVSVHASLLTFAGSAWQICGNFFACFLCVCVSPISLLLHALAGMATALGSVKGKKRGGGSEERRDDWRRTHRHEVTRTHE